MKRYSSSKSCSMNFSSCSVLNIFLLILLICALIYIILKLSGVKYFEFLDEKGSISYDIANNENKDINFTQSNFSSANVDINIGSDVSSFSLTIKDDSTNKKEQKTLTIKVKQGGKEIFNTLKRVKAGDKLTIKKEGDSWSFSS